MTLDIARERLHNQYISHTPLSKPGEVVEWLVAVQAQDYAGAKWALGLRLQSATDADIDAAFADGSILRTHLMRPTWHFVSPRDIRWMLALTAPRVHLANAFYYRKLGLDSAIFKLSNTVMVKALQNGNQLTRDELSALLQDAGIDTNDGLRLAYLMMYAELEGLICSGARRGKQFTYALLDERAPNARLMEREEALAELARRYFASRGPATVQDFAKWSGLTVADAGNGLEVVRSELHHERIGDHVYWFSASRAFAKGDLPIAYLLSIYDEYLSGYKDRRAIGTPKVGEKLVALGNALSYIIVVDGQIVGTWKRMLRKDAVDIEINLFNQPTQAESRAIALAAQRYGDFLELPIELTSISGDVQ